MKTVKIILIVLWAGLSGSNAYAQVHDHSNIDRSIKEVKRNTTSAKTETIKVRGKCEICQANIEKASRVEGVNKASWNKTTGLLTLVYDDSKVKSDDIQKKIAAVGYDTEKYKADNKAYAKLNACCQYERKKYD